MRMLILAIMMNIVMGAYDFELCKNEEDCPSDLRPLTDTCALLVAEKDDDNDKKEGMVCVDDIFCDGKMKFWWEGADLERNFDVYCGAKAFWYNNKVWFIIVIILIVVLLLGAIYCCCCKKDKNSAF